MNVELQDLADIQYVMRVLKDKNASDQDRHAAEYLLEGFRLKLIEAVMGTT